MQDNSTRAGAHWKAGHTRSICSHTCGTTQAFLVLASGIYENVMHLLPKWLWAFSLLFLVQTVVYILFGSLSSKNTLNTLGAGLVTHETQLTADLGGSG